MRECCVGVWEEVASSSSSSSVVSAPAVNGGKLFGKKRSDISGQRCRIQTIVTV